MTSWSSVGECLRALHEKDEVPIQSILSDLPYTLQGLKTNNLAWTPNGLVLPSKLMWPSLGLLHRLGEPALLYREIRTVLATLPPGLLMQALCSAVEEKLEDYLEFVGQLEKEVRQRSDMTLSRCLVMIRKTTDGLRLLHSLLIDTCSLQGGAILSAIYKYTKHGDPFVCSLSQEILDQVWCPFREILQHWVSDGILSDPFDEFFVTIDDQRSRWAGRFKFLPERVPEEMSQSSAHRSFEIGKGVYFLRSICNDHEFTLSAVPQRVVTSELPTINRLIDSNYEIVVTRVNEVLMDKHKLMIHLAALQDYLLLCRGDFADALVSEGYQTLVHRSHTLRLHQVAAVLESAIMALDTENHETKYILDRLDARLLELGKAENGWEVFTLKYRVDPPLDVIIGAQTMRQFLKIFNMLWRIRWSFFVLKTGWTLLLRKQSNSPIWSYVRKTHFKMFHFMTALQTFIYSHVIENEWKQLTASLCGSKVTVDEIIAMHEQYLSNIIMRVLFGGSVKIIDSLHNLMKNVQQFQRNVNTLAERPSQEDGQLEESIRTQGKTFEMSLDAFLVLLRKIDDNARVFALLVDFVEAHTEASSHAHVSQPC